nr:hypothetical protein [uncultured Mediterranean phage uvMED]
MAYIGKTPITGNFVKLDAISVVNGQAGYTMNNGGSAFTDYENVNQFLVSLNGILQSPTDSFSVSGSTLTFASNLATGDVIDFVIVLGNTLDIGTPSDATVTQAKTNFVSTSSAAGLQIKGDSTTAGTLQLNCEQNSHGVKLRSPAHSSGQSYTLTLPTGNVTADKVLKVASVSGSGTTGIGQLSFADAGGGLEMLDMWYTNSNQSISSGTGTVATNWARVTETGFGQIGTGMTHSSGIFTFPATGFYLVVFNLQAFTSANGENRSIEAQLEYTTNNSSYGSTATGRGNTSETGSSTYGGAYTEFVFDITDVSNQKVRTKVFGDEAFTLIGDSSDRVYTSIRFMKLANT